MGRELEEWEERIIIMIPKKGDRSNCTNWREITHLNIPSKILVRDILNRTRNASLKRTSLIP
jgi:hypothetical protein